jgi:alkylation response protein AidB-like acyl-CoA dehydrogenase
LGSGAKFASYCLTEPGSGSDALGAKTKAILSEDGKHYILNGQKMWITNAGFADIFIVFAQIDGNQFTGFIVEKDTEGLTLGAEEDKMGIKGSSTRQVFLENVKVPIENVLGEIGKGHKIAFNVLNIGRYKLCVMALGGARRMLDLGINYANERQQFGTSISNFGAIKEKIANMAISIFASESSSYRVSGLINDLSEKLIKDGATKSEAKLAAAEEYSIECAALKVLGSETLDLVTDEVVQIYGGMGYSEEAPAARAYRDSRINRIFEGTNEINRLLAVGTLAKKAMKGQLDLMKPAMEAQKDLMSISFDEPSDALFDREYKTIEKAKKAILLVAGGAMQKYMLEFEKQQELIMSIADMLFDVLQAESTLLRVHKLVEQNGIENEALKVDVLNIFMSESMERIYINGKKAISNFAEGDMLTMMHMGLKRFTKYPILDTISAKRRIADYCIKENMFKL